MSSDQEKTERAVPTHRHRVLLVDDDAATGKALGRILEQEGLGFTILDNGEKGIKALENAASPFSLILSDQRMPGMLGTEFLSRAKAIAPDSIRYLITGYAEMDTIIDAVNNGAVQHYISKPWDREELRRIIRDGISIFEKHLDSERLFSLAKKQNSKLFELNCELMEQTKKLETQRHKLDQKIADLKKQMSACPGSSDTDPAQVIKALTTWLSQAGNPEQYTALKHRTLAALYDAFTDLALRNGMEMPDIVLGSQAAEGSHD
jgi:response regulator RpfG family c-di-GMP phosphodiesterase